MVKMIRIVCNNSNRDPACLMYKIEWTNLVQILLLFLYKSKKKY